MFQRLCKLSLNNSFFLFGARATGKSTLVRGLGKGLNMVSVDLLDPAQYEEATLRPSELAARIRGIAGPDTWIFIDEVQKAPRILDVAQQLIDQKDARFILTGSSARKVKRGGANLLAGRAYNYQLYPLTSVELGSSFDLNHYLSLGGLPRTWNISDAQERIIYLRSYVSTYLKEEIAEEQIVRKLEPFGRFLQVAAQCSGKVINYSSIAKDVGTSDQTVKTYFQILEDTLVGFILPAFSESVRKSQGQSPKFYLFDTGVLRTLQRVIDQPLSDRNYEYGNLFEHFIIHEIKRRAEYLGRDYSYSFLRTQRDQEIDLIIERPGRKRAVIEIKSTTQIREADVNILKQLGSDIQDAELFCLSRDPDRKRYGEIIAINWKDGIEEILDY